MSNLLTIDLEKALLKQNKKVITSKELLEVMEFEKRGELLKSNALERMGITDSLKEGKSIKTRVNNLKEETLKFDQSIVFHISQIEKTCMKYYLRFLPTAYYKGTLDEQLPFKVATFELAHGVELYSSTKKNYDNSLYDFTSFRLPIYDELLGRTRVKKEEPKPKVKNSFIMAPEESFNLEEKPKDPLLFYKINDEYYYLIHKWGNDLSIGRRLKSVLSGWKGNHIVAAISSISLTYMVASVTDSPKHIILWIGISVISYWATILLTMIKTGDVMIKKNEWNSKFRD